MHIRDMTHKMEETQLHLETARKGLAFSDKRIQRLEREVGEMRLHNSTGAAFGAIDETRYRSPPALDYTNPFTAWCPPENH
jgi:hypothetical protein